MVNKSIFCCECDKDVDARLTNGKEIYPHRQDLSERSFWKCDACGYYVGCHKSGDCTYPLGVIANKELNNARQHIHNILDPLWQKGWLKRRDVYKKISEEIGYEYHTAKIRTIEEARNIYKIVKGFYGK